MVNTLLIPAEEMKSVFAGILKKEGYTSAKAEKIAGIFTTNTLEGVQTHGVNRFTRFINNTRDGYIKPDAEPTLIQAFGSVERWDGNLGPGPLNAVIAADRAMKLADMNGIGLVTMANTNHWMRGGLYGWHTARKGYVFIGWTNTIANMPAWGAADPHLGNNPFVLAVPFGNDAVVLDFAMSLYSYGKMEAYAREGKKLAYPGGFDRTGSITDDPVSILESWRTLPIGYWKGSSLSLLLDLLAAVLSGGSSVHEIMARKVEYCVSQVFIAIDISHLGSSGSVKDIVQGIIDDVHSSIPVDEASKVRYPGENISKIREEALKNGISVSAAVWEEILSLKQ